MTRLIVWCVVATCVELGAFAAVVHAVLRYAMLARGLPTWRVADTLLTSPLLWIGATLAAGSLTWLVAATAFRAGRDTPSSSGMAVAAIAALLGAAIAWFGVRAIGKLY